MPSPWTVSGAIASAGVSGRTSAAPLAASGVAAIACGELHAASSNKALFTRAVWRCASACGATALLPATAAPTECVLDEWSDLVDELRRAREANRRRRLAERHVLEQTRQRARAVLRVIDHVQLLVVGGEIGGVARGVEVDVVAAVGAEAFRRDLQRLREHALRGRAVVGEVGRLGRVPQYEPVRE